MKVKTKHKQEIRVKHVYDKHLKTDGYRILVDRLWPRGLSMKKEKLDEWAKEIAPAHKLRYWFDHLPENWKEFEKKYIAELNQNKAIDDFIGRHKNKKLLTLIHLTLIHSTHYAHLTLAIMLKQFLEHTCYA